MTQKKKQPQRQARTTPPRGRVIRIERGEIQWRGEGGMHVDERGRIVLGNEHPRRWQGDRIEVVLQALFPNKKIPPPDQVPNSNLVQMVLTYMDKHGMSSPLPLPSPESILRAAGRKKRKA